MNEEYIKRRSLIQNLRTFAPEHYTPLVDLLIEKEPAADVVPRAVIAEIFAEISNMMVLQYGFNESHIVAHIDFESLKELRKKYTEGEG